MVLRFRKFKEIVKDRASIYGLTLVEVAEQAGIAPRTFYRRLDSPRDMTLSELQRMNNVLHFTDEERMALTDRATW